MPRMLCILSVLVGVLALETLSVAATWGTLHWQAPASSPSLGGGERIIYTLWRRGANQAAYRRVRNLPVTTFSFRVTLPQSSGYVCYRISALKVPIGGITIYEASPFAEVQGFPGCLALCLAGAEPLRDLDGDECTPSY